MSKNEKTKKREQKKRTLLSANHTLPDIEIARS